MKFFLLIFFLLLQSYAYAEEFVIIVNKDGPLINADALLIRDIYLGEKRFSTAGALMPLNAPEGPLKDSFLKKMLSMSSKEYKLYWIRKVFQEGLEIPQIIATAADRIEFVRTERGSIAYIPKSSLKEKDSVIIITPR